MVAAPRGGEVAPAYRLPLASRLAYSATHRLFMLFIFCCSSSPNPNLSPRRMTGSILLLCLWPKWAPANAWVTSGGGVRALVRETALLSWHASNLRSIGKT